MDLGQVGFIGLVVITIVGALKDVFPTMTGNITRLVALVIGAILGAFGQLNLLMGVDVNIVTGMMAGVAAVGTITAIERVGNG